ncbi:hypothetical protein M1247_25180 [Mycobacterium sp. 21AC1]|uniref:hypothetical protein n=1 Tax=[Mycobacterium] appelbergii TaxID=2939269 RepID=UPI002939490B|nr:hypothetical protein [Mycobacterium sp. 21AC1]MDV3128231.1 hypothetical protein [Mycobacterium sp. 21AC1]
MTDLGVFTFHLVEMPIVAAVPLLCRPPQAAHVAPRSIPTFSIWNSVRAMTDMVHGHSGIAEVADPAMHADAMAERRRRDFHHEFATYRFRPLSEYGSWNGRTCYVPRRSSL